jgi:hypothetical protein
LFVKLVIHSFLGNWFHYFFVFEQPWISERIGVIWRRLQREIYYGRMHVICKYIAYTLMYIDAIYSVSWY